MYTEYNLSKVGQNESFKIAQFLASETIRRISGLNQMEIIDNKPSSRFFSGTLFGLTFFNDEEELTRDSDSTLDTNNVESLEINAEIDSVDDSDSSTLLMGSRRVSPQSCGLRFHLKEKSGRMCVTVKFDLWGRVIPNYSQCIRNSNEDRIAIRPIDIPQRWVRVGTAEVHGEVDILDIDNCINQLNENINREITRIIDEFTNRRDIYRIPKRQQTIPANEEKFNEWVNSYSGSIFQPSWNVEVEYLLVNIPLENGNTNYRLDIRLVNNTRSEFGNRLVHENSIFCPKLVIDVRGNNTIIRHKPSDIRLQDPRQDYVGILADGLACVSEEIPDENGNPNSIVETVATPVYSQPLLSHTSFAETNINQIRNDPYKAASTFLKRMERFDEHEWAQEIQREADGGRPQHIQRAEIERRMFREETERIRNTTNLLSPKKGDPDVRQAFNLMIETILRMNNARESNHTKRPLNSFRPFQFGFILATIPDIVQRRLAAVQGNTDFISEADLIWFPTGGGKTEAFQALAIFTAFYDRIKGKETGISSWMHFALRALTVQQTQRLFEIVYHAECIRSDNRINGQPFRVGFLVGGQYSPTEVNTREYGENTEQRIIEKINSDNRAYVFTTNCPECGYNSIRSRWNRDLWNIEFFCSNERCTIHQNALPVTVVDDDIRRFPPAFIVGTIDKITGAGLTDKFHSLLRNPLFACPRHGYSPVKDNTCRYYYPERCDMEVLPVERMDSGPTLVIIDEVHLLEEELGAFASHYFSLLWEIQRSGGFPVPKVVLSSATMTEAATAEGIGETVPYSSTQVWNLTGLRPRRFPSPPPSRNISFYYTRDEDVTQRFFIGIHPHGKTENDTVIHTLRVIHSILQDLFEGDLNELLGRILNDEQKRRLLLPYWTTIDYVLALKQADGIKNSIDVQLNNYMNAEQREPINASDVVCSRMRPYELADILRSLESMDPSDIENRYDTIPASSSIAYGVDIQNINTMILVGQPRRVSEDIQVTSRTARSQDNIGLVFRLYHPVRQRDMTHYLLFHNYHGNQDLLVEDVALNRFLSRSIRRTMPGIFMALLYNTDVHRNRTIDMRWRPLDCKRYLQNEANCNGIHESISRIFMERHPGNEVFDSQVGIVFDANLDAILNNNNPNVGKWGTPELLQDVPMMSLRDVDPQIQISPNTRNVNPSALHDAGLNRRTMERSRIQIILSHTPGATFEYQGGETIVKSLRIEPDTQQLPVLQVHRLALAQNLCSLVAGTSWASRFWRGGNFLDNFSNQIVAVRPGRVFVEIFPLTLRCNNNICQHVWRFDPSTEDMTCPRCRTGKGKQIRHIAVHECGNIESLYVPGCEEHRRGYIKLNSTPQEVSRWRWICDENGHDHVLNFSPNRQRCFICEGGAHD
jgi:hypothetical protein